MTLMDVDTEERQKVDTTIAAWAVLQWHHEERPETRQTCHAIVTRGQLILDRRLEWYGPLEAFDSIGFFSADGEKVFCMHTPEPRKLEAGGKFVLDPVTGFS